MLRIRIYSALAVPLLTMALASAQDCHGPGDLDHDFTVGALDFARGLPCIGGADVSAPPNACGDDDFAKADLDADGDVDLRDVARFALLFGQPYFDYAPYRADKEAEWLAIELTGQLRAPDAEYERIHRDLQFIRGAYPELADVTVWHRYGPNSLMVRLSLDLPPSGFDRLNAFYQVVSDYTYQFLEGLHALHYCDTLDATVLAQEYEALPEVIRASPNWTFGGGDHIYLTPSGRVNEYQFVRGYGDCPSGCLCSTVWDVAVDEGGNVGPISCFDTCTGECP